MKMNKKEFFQEILENIGKKVDFAELMRIADLAVPPLSYGPHSQLLLLLLKGFFVDDGQTVNKFYLYY